MLHRPSPLKSVLSIVVASLMLAGCVSSKVDTTGNPEYDAKLFLGAWSAAHLLPDSDYKRLWIVVYRDDGTFFVSHRVYMGQNPPHESLYSGRWRLEGGNYIESASAHDRPESLYYYKIIDRNNIFVSRGDEYQYTLSRLK